VNGGKWCACHKCGKVTYTDDSGLCVFCRLCQPRDRAKPQTLEVHAVPAPLSALWERRKGGQR